MGSSDRGMQGQPTTRGRVAAGTNGLIGWDHVLYL
jgi:hypothetical protein